MCRNPFGELSIFMLSTLPTLDLSKYVGLIIVVMKAE